jgi:hypothetical protein
MLDPRRTPHHAAATIRLNSVWGVEMGWFSRITRFGDVHLVYGQEANMSCGIASVMMCVFKINKLKPGADAVTVEKDIYKKYESASGGQYKPNKVGTGPLHLVTVLNGLNCGTWKWDKVAANDAPKRIIDVVGVSSLGPVVEVNPLIIGVDWDTGGAHWIVVDTVRNVFNTHYATICDPWDTNVHIQSLAVGSPFVYEAGKGGFSVDFFGGHKGQTSPYGAKDIGKTKTWGMIYRN